MKAELENKYRILQEYLKSFGRLAVAFSGGVDSTLLLKAAHDVLGDQLLAVTVSSASFPQREKDESEEYCKKEGIRHIYCQVNEMEIEGFSDNPPNRCYLCKKEIFSRIMDIAGKQGISAVAEGSNMDDNGDYRPGMIAIRELGVKSPLRYAGLSKQEIRDLSRELGLPTWCKPSLACLATRFVYGEKITSEKLAMVEEAEQLLFDMGFSQVRVRIHDTLARIEVFPREFDKIMEDENRRKIERELSRMGFSYVTLDLKGFRSGSMNEGLTKEEMEEWSS